MFKAIVFALRKVRASSPAIFMLFIFLSLFLTVFTFGNTIILKEMVDTVNGAPTILQLSLTGVLVVKIIWDVLNLILDSTRDFQIALLKKKMSVLMLSELVNKTASLDVASLEDPKTVGIISRAYSRIHFQFEYFFRNIVNLGTSFIEAMLSLAFFIAASPLGALAILITSLTTTVIKGKLGNSNFNIYKADYETRLKFGYTTDLLNQRETLLELKLFQNFEYIRKKVVGIFTSFIDKEIAHEKRNLLYARLSELLPLVAGFVFMLLMADQLSKGQITAGTFVFLFTNMMIFAGGMYRFGQSFGSVAAEANSIKDLMEFYELKPRISDSSKLSKQAIQDWQLKLAKPEISFENVSYKYPNADKYAVSNVSLRIPYSQNLALIGENGAGKSTLVKLLLRVYDPTEGVVKINGIDIKKVPLSILYGLMGTLFQSFGRFNLTVKENLEIAANKKLSEAEMIAYLKYANAWNFIENTRGKLDQQLGPEFKDGVDLSGGQWQSLAIARTFARNAPIVILDEPTSAIDPKSEMEIFDRINQKMRSETLIFISHRFSTIKDAERIVVLEKGKVIEDGTHADLIGHGSKYAQLYNIQMERFLRENKYDNG